MFSFWHHFCISNVFAINVFVLALTACYFICGTFCCCIFKCVFESALFLNLQLVSLNGSDSVCCSVCSLADHHKNFLKKDSESVLL